MRFGVFLLLALAALPAHAQDVEPLSSEDDLTAYCLGVNRQLAERFRQMQLWGLRQGFVDAMVPRREGFRARGDAHPRAAGDPLRQRVDP